MIVAGTALVLATLVSALRTIVVPRATSARITRFTFVMVRKVLGWVAHEGRTYEERDRILAVFAPLSLILLPFVWTLLVMAGFTAIHWGVDAESWRDAFLVSGSSMVTLGNVFHADIPSAALSFLQASIGLLLIALLISYLPTIYSSFSRRERLVAILESRAGLPPSPVEALTRYQRIELLDGIDADMFVAWEGWFVDVEESHTSIGALAFFRSPQPERSWITAAGCVLDTASIYLGVVDVDWSPHAALCIRTGTLALRRIAASFGIPFDPDPSPTDPVSVSRREFDNMCVELIAIGIPIKADRERAWADFAGWRVNYDTVLVSLAKMVDAPEGKWSSDRPGVRYTPRIWTRRLSD